MFKEALEYIVSMREPKIIEVDGENYSDKPLTRISHNPKAEPIGLATLSSLLKYIITGDDVGESEKMFLHVVSPERVELWSYLYADRERECLAVVEAQVPEFRFGRYYDHEAFLIALQSKFLDNEDRSLLLKFAGTVANGSVAEYGDDGVTQKATIKTGIASKGDAVVPNPVKLIPYRTFVEVEQPGSQFIFRMRDSGNGVECAVFEADGGAWKMDAMENIAAYLRQTLDDHGYGNITVIA